MDAAMVAQVRRFNRTVTQRVGALQEEFLGRGRPLGAARVLWEIGPEGRDVRTLRAQLGLDSGYLSRLLRSLEADALITIEADPSDRRVRLARLTPEGVAEREALDRRSDDVAAALLAPLAPAQRDRLAAAMADVERLLRAGMIEIAVADPAHPDARHCLRAYFAELDRRFDAGFDVEQSNPAPDGGLRPPAGILLVARLGAEPVGCGALKFGADGVCEVKRMWVSSGVRGTGLGRRLLGELETRAAEAGARVLRLETNRTLVEAIALYRSAGYTEVPAFNEESYAHHWFEKRLAPRGAEGGA
ncbi:MarR family transcriptional regulator with acetyltransferase activity [Pseudonocardia hierapolitana]|uniref:MarR family transcriptional regulator with acetyltransferase activity n=1 Tax=Pseudonocardia hierapolitana TaxID=1128676 RepID=A0A561SIG3_9PSEU|nr:bifunctional helix-turn-helix transcriptional regulator/GNAT family N-acetyltransferase [Pseudonocardia hierapolitana]TWF74668.1 MarR family transcriptional regulator with acetyltransferase activity [Pseudonocardia hierapolitana]